MSHTYGSSGHVCHTGMSKLPYSFESYLFPSSFSNLADTTNFSLFDLYSKRNNYVTVTKLQTRNEFYRSKELMLMLHRQQQQYSTYLFI